ncbi:MAG: nuclear transport factor 2 family protein [Gammaproteobacteria bacterium]|nr:nuclear transport factor 2 family protein [Gammaproteobacteria bacterium]
MKINKLIVLAFAVCIFAINSYADSDKDAQIHAMLLEMDKAIENKDAETIAKYLDDNIHIVMKVTMGGNDQVFQFSKDDYLKTMEDGWAVTEEYTYTRDKVNIEYIGGGNKAVITASVYELSVVAGRPMAALSHEKILVEFRDSKPVIINLTANTNVRM